MDLQLVKLMVVGYPYLVATEKLKGLRLAKWKDHRLVKLTGHRSAKLKDHRLVK
jgi:hypothetical protein